MARVNIPIATGATTHTNVYDSIYGLLQTLSVQDITNCEVGSTLADEFDTVVIGNGQYVQDIFIKMAKDAYLFVGGKPFADYVDGTETLNRPEFVEEFAETWVKRQYNMGYNRKDLATMLAQGKNEEAIKNDAISNIAKKKILDDEAYNLELITSTTNKSKVVQSGATTGEVNLSTFKTITSDLKDVPYNIRQIINKLTKFNSWASTRGYESGTSADQIVVYMSETAQNILDTYCKTGIYNLQFLYDNFAMRTIPDQYLTDNNLSLDVIYIFDKRHIKKYIRDEVTESAYDVPSQTYGVFYTLEEMHRTTGFFKACYFDASTALGAYHA